VCTSSAKFDGSALVLLPCCRLAEFLAYCLSYCFVASLFYMVCPPPLTPCKPGHLLCVTGLAARLSCQAALVLAQCAIRLHTRLLTCLPVADCHMLTATMLAVCLSAD
jgi:hypothetical protein